MSEPINDLEESLMYF